MPAASPTPRTPHIIMKDESIFSSIDPELLGRLSTRRSAFARLLKLGGITITAPIVLASLAQDAYGKSLPGEVLEVLRFALLLEHLEDEFYDKAMQAPGLIPDRYRRIFGQVKQHEQAHVTLLATATVSPVNTHKFDYTAGGMFPDVFRNFATFLAVSQMFEDTGVKAYKGQAPKLMGSKSLFLSIALRIHSVEARHAAVVRRIRGEKAWITGSSRGSLPAAAQPIYANDGATTQLGINLAGIGGTPASAASEAFDEALTKQQVIAIVRPFITSGDLPN